MGKLQDRENKRKSVIGDSLSADIKGAQNAGLDSLWYNPNRKANTLPIPPNFEAASYEDIVRILL